jgi:hypothetical protein
MGTQHITTFPDVRKNIPHYPLTEKNESLSMEATELTAHPHTFNSSFIRHRDSFIELDAQCSCGGTLHAFDGVGRVSARRR